MYFTGTNKIYINIWILCTTEKERGVKCLDKDPEKDIYGCEHTQPFGFLASD